MTGTPASCIWAVQDSETVASIPSNPGKPTFPNWSLITLPLRSVIDPVGLITGFTYLAPNSARKPLYPPGSSGSVSGRACFDLHSAEPCAQWMPIPTKSACDFGAVFGVVVDAPYSALTWAASAEVGPKTVGMSIPVFSRMVLAVATEPTLHPARVYGTHGAGAIFPFSLIISCVKSVWPAGGKGGPAGSDSGAVQYAKDTPVRLVPVGCKDRE